MRRRIATTGLWAAAWVLAALVVHAQSETFTATAEVKTVASAPMGAPVTIVVSRKMSQAEADKFLDVFRSGGAVALRKALDGVPETGTVQIGSSKPVNTRLTLERATEKGRLLTIVTDTPIVFLGAGVPNARPREGFDFGLIDIEVDAAGHGTGTIAPAAKITYKERYFVVEDYSGEIIRLAGVSKK